MDKNEAIEVLKKYQYDPEVREALECLHPELKKSEDERMIRIIEDAICTNEAQELVRTKYGLELTDLADWLEKQGSQNLANSAKTCKVEQNPAWSEDTQQWIDAIIKDYEKQYDVDKDHRATIQIQIDILKSLKERYAWKPSDE